MDIRIIYPENRVVSEETVIVWAHDTLVNNAFSVLPDAEKQNDNAIELLSKSIPVPELFDAIAILEDAGEVTFQFRAKSRR